MNLSTAHIGVAMKLPCARAAFVALLLASSVLAQNSQNLYRPTSTTRDVLGEERLGTQPVVPPPPTEAPPSPAPASSFLAKFDYTYLPDIGSDGFGIQDIEVSSKTTVNLGDPWGPIWVTPGFGVHCWQGPDSRFPCGCPVDMPGAVYDLYVDLGWRPRPYEWLFLDFQFTPGIYTDFHNTDSSMFRPRGRALAIVALSERFQMVAGILYTNRLRTTMIPAGGIMWKPNDDTQVDLVFPAPKISRRVLTTGETKWWAYVAGEFGGGAWAIERAAGFDDSVDYTDLRALVGVEAVSANNHKAHLECGYVFARRISYGSERPGSFDPTPTIVLRAGVSY